jgi:hypothetical protein
MACAATMRRNSSSPANSDSSGECPQNQLAPHPEKLEHEKGGFDIVQRFRITAVQTAECPKPVRGTRRHTYQSVTPIAHCSLKLRLLRDRNGFELPVRSALRAQLMIFRKTG